MIATLPHFLSVGGIEREIYTDFRYILEIVTMYSDPELSDKEKTIAMLEMLYKEDWAEFGDVEEAVAKGIWFLDCGRPRAKETKGEEAPRIMDWEQDFPIIISAINRVAGREVREMEYCHWWTFIGWYNEIGECFFQQVVNIRQKIANGDNLEKWEKKMLRDNRETVLLKDKLTEEQENEINELFKG